MFALSTVTMMKLKKAFSSIRRIFKSDEREAPPPVRTGAAPVIHKTTKPRRVEPDVPIDQLERAYIPPQTSFKTSFRADGSDRQRDQEIIPGYMEERFLDEDIYTNKYFKN